MITDRKSVAWKAFANFYKGNRQDVIVFNMLFNYEKIYIFGFILSSILLTKYFIFCIFYINTNILLQVCCWWLSQPTCRQHDHSKVKTMKTKTMIRQSKLHSRFTEAWKVLAFSFSLQLVSFRNSYIIIHGFRSRWSWIVITVTIYLL